MGLRTIINTSAEPMDSGQMHGMKHDCDNEDTDVGSDHITASLLLNRSMSSPEVKDNAISQNANTDVMQLADTQEDVPSDPFVFSVHQLEGNKVRTTNGMSPSLAAQQLLIERPCDSSVCPHDPEPSTSKEDLLSKNIDNKEKNSMSDSTNGKCNLNLNNLGNSDRKIENDLRRIAEPDEDKEYQLSVRVPYENSTEYMGKTALCQEISPDIHKQEVSETDIRSERRREIIGTAPLSPNHYGSILVSAVPPSFQINKRSEVPGSCKTVSETNARRMIIAPERKFSVDLKELQQKKRKIEEEQLSSSNLNVSSLSSRAVEDQLQVPNEQVLNRALDLLRKPVQDNVNEPKNVPKRNYSKKVGSNMIGENKDSLCRKVLQEKIGKLRDKNGLALSVPHLERAHLSQLVNLLQRFKTHLATENFISKDISSHVFSDSTTMSVAKPQVAKNTRAEKSERQLIKYILDADATESENSDEETEGQLPSTSSAYLPHKNVSSDAYYSERVRLGALDATALCMEEDCEEKMITIYRQLDHIKNQKKSLHTWSVNDGCARCMPFDGSRRRILKRRRLDEAEGKNCMRNEISTTLDTVGRLQAYATVDDRVNPQLSSISEIPVERRAETYCRRKSTRPAIHLHKSFNRSPWTTYLEDRKVAVKEAVIVDDRQARRKREKSESEESYDDDEDYRPSSTFSRRDSCSKRSSVMKRSAQNFARRSHDRKRNGDFRSRKLISQRLRLSRTKYDIEDGVVEIMPGLPQKIDYKEICIPHWERKSLDLTAEEGSGCAHLAECSCVANISRRHLPYELNERKRFQQYRDYVAAKSAATASKLSGSSHSKLRATSTAPSATGSADSPSFLGSTQSVSAVPSPAAPYYAFDDDQLSSNNDLVSSVPDYDRPSLISPYSPRVFPIPEVKCYIAETSKN